jgi:hypothetical protein
MVEEEGHTVRSGMEHTGKLEGEDRLLGHSLEGEGSLVEGMVQEDSPLDSLEGRVVEGSHLEGEDR